MPKRSDHEFVRVVGIASVLVVLIASLLLHEIYGFHGMIGCACTAEEKLGNIDPSGRPPTLCFLETLTSRISDQLSFCGYEAIGAAFVISICMALVPFAGAAVCHIADYRHPYHPGTSSLGLALGIVMSFVFLAAAILSPQWVTRPNTATITHKPVKQLPDLLLIFVDDMNADLWAPWAHHTPVGFFRFEPQTRPRRLTQVDLQNIDAFAARSGTTTFTEAYAHVPLCAPSRVSILTGLSVARTGMRRDCQCSHWK